MLPTDRTGGAGCRIWEQRDRFATFEIADDCPVTLVASPCLVVDPDYCRGVESGVPRQRTRRRSVVADWQHQTTGEARRRSTAQGEREMMHDMVEPSGSASVALLATAASSGKRADAACGR